MESHHRKKGFTLAETLMVVAIITILGGVAFIAVIRYMRTMAQLERDGIAKEIFVSAQNHLTMASGQGYLGRTDFGTKEAADSGVYYFVVNGESSFTGEKVLDLMLPFASVDETVRLGGSYIVRYQKDPALVLDVFYSTPSRTRFGHTLSAGDYGTVMGMRDEEGVSRRNDRRSWGSDRAVLGWYGGEDALNLPRGQELKVPEIEVINAERLTVKIKDFNTSYNEASLTLIVTGEVSGQKKAFPLTYGSLAASNITDDNGLDITYTVVLDDVTTPGLHFHELMEGFIPGEDLSIQAVAFSNTVLTNVAQTAVKRTNSLFESIRAGNSGTGQEPGVPGDGTGAGAGSEPGAGTGTGGTPTPVSGTGLTACINNIRHLENLAAAVSGVNTRANSGADASKQVGIAGALQTTDLDWNGFCAKIAQDTSGSADTVRIYGTGSSEGTQPGCYRPVDTVLTGDGASYPLDYDGQGHRISNIRVNSSTDAGLFGTLEEESRISNLMLVDFDITSTGGSAGALAGTLKDTTVTNVLAQGAEGSVAVTGGSGSAGGLAGTAEGGSFTACAAALKVKNTASGANANAGGLIGTASGSTSVNGCYSAGHTQDGRYTGADTEADVYSQEGKAGGLIGDAGGSAVSSSYSTCSVTGGDLAGGFVGTASGQIRNCYTTGLVRTTGFSGNSAGGEGSVPDPAPGAPDPEKAGAFAGAFKGTAQNCIYLGVMNEVLAADGFTVLPLPAVGGRALPGTDGAGSGSGDPAGITAADTGTDTYSAFIGTPSDWQNAGPYDNTLIQYYQGKYSFRTVTQLDSDLNQETEPFAAVHYGDWPAPEIMFENKQ